MRLSPDQRLLHFRIVYAGAPLSGKTQSLRSLFDGFQGPAADEAVYSPQEARGRTLYFDWGEYTGGRFRGAELSCQILTVPGQATLAERRRILIEAADVVVFVVDSQPGRHDDNRESHLEITPWLQRGDLPPIDVVYQLNKRDLEDAEDPPVLLSNLGLGEETPSFPGSALLGTGLRACFVEAVRRCIRRAEHLRSIDRLESGTPEIETSAQLLQILRGAAEDSSAEQVPEPERQSPAPPRPEVPPTPVEAEPRASALAGPEEPKATQRPAVIPMADWLAGRTESTHRPSSEAGGTTVAAAPPPAASEPAPKPVPKPSPAPTPTDPQRPSWSVMPMADWRRSRESPADEPRSPTTGPIPAAAVPTPSPEPEPELTPETRPPGSRDRVGEPQPSAQAPTGTSRRQDESAAGSWSVMPMAEWRRLQEGGPDETEAPVPSHPEPSERPAEPERAPARTTARGNPVAAVDRIAAETAAAAKDRPRAVRRESPPPAPWLPDHGRELVQSWPEEIWVEALADVQGNGARPRWVDGALEARLGGSWSARCAAGPADRSEVVAEFHRLARWLQELHGTTSRRRCLVLARDTEDRWCTWQIRHHLTPFDQLVHRTCDGSHSPARSAQMLVNVAVAFLAARKAARGCGLPIELGTLAREENRTVFADYLPPVPLPSGTETAMAALEHQLGALFAEVGTDAIDVPEILRELERIQHSRPKQQPAIELIQALLIGT